MSIEDSSVQGAVALAEESVEGKTEIELLGECLKEQTGPLV